MRPVLPVLVPFLLLAGCVLPRSHYRYARVIDEPAMVGVVPDRLPGRRPWDERERNDAPRRREIPAGPMDLDTTVTIALANNPDIGAAVARIRQAEALLAKARAAFAPRIGGHLEYVRADAPSTFLFKRIDQREFGQDTNFNDPGVIDNFEAGVGASLNLLNGGRDVLATWQAETGKRLGELDRRTARNALTASVITAWYDLRASGRYVATAEASVNTVRAQLDERRKVFEEGGDALKSDVLALEVRLAEASERLIAARNQRELAAAALANLLGGDADTPVAADPEAECTCAVPETYEAALLEAMLYRPELLAVHARVEQAALAIGQAESAFHPRLDAQTRFWWDDSDMHFNKHGTNWMLGARLEWLLGDGGARQAEVVRSRAALREALAADRKLTLRVQLDVKRSYLAMEAAEARLEVATASVAAAREALDLVAKQYAAGTATVTRYLEAELMLTRARLRRTQARHDTMKARAEASRAIGRFGRLESDADGDVELEFAPHAADDGEEQP